MFSEMIIQKSSIAVSSLRGIHTLYKKVEQTDLRCDCYNHLCIRLEWYLIFWAISAIFVLPIQIGSFCSDFV